MENMEYKRLINKYLSGEITEKEKLDLLNWFVSDKDMDVWWADEINKMDDEMNQDVQGRLLTEMKSKIADGMIISKTVTKPVEGLRYKLFLKWVAAIFIPVILAVSLYSILYQNTELSSLIVIADQGERSSVVLPDRTTVKLNSASELTYPGYFGKERRVKLKGEAYFNVVPDKEHPFIVELGDIDVKVLGTSFNISSYADQEDITIVLLEGKIEVLSGDEVYSMSPNDKMVFNKPAASIHMSKVYSEDYIEWMNGNLFFENETLENIAKVLSRTYDLEIEFASEILKSERFTGSIGRGGVLSALDRLSLASPIVYEIKNSVIILKKKESK